MFSLFPVGHRRVGGAAGGGAPGEAAGGLQHGDDAEVPDAGGPPHKHSHDARHAGRSDDDDDAARAPGVHRGLPDEAAAHRHATRYVREFKR